MAVIRIIVLHRNRLAAEAIARTLDAETGFAAFRYDGEHETRALLQAARQRDAGIIILDFCRSSLQLASRLRKRNIGRRGPRTLIIGVPHSDADILDVIQAGASGYEELDAGMVELVANIRALSSGQTKCSPHVATLLFDQLAKRRSVNSQSNLPAESQLTRRELEVIALVEDGLSNKTIAVQLNLSVQTVKNHVHNILNKLRLSRRTEAAQFARKHNLLGRNAGYWYQTGTTQTHEDF
jgi:DNA-binding NarL/FixJ family response regulator